MRWFRSFYETTWWGRGTSFPLCLVRTAVESKNETFHQSGNIMYQNIKMHTSELNRVVLFCFFISVKQTKHKAVESVVSCLHTAGSVQWDVSFLLCEVFAHIIRNEARLQHKPALCPVLPLVAFLHHISLQRKRNMRIFFFLPVLGVMSTLWIGPTGSAEEATH